MALLKTLVNYISSSSSRNKRSTFIGFLTVFTVVLFLSYLQNALSFAPLIFVKFAEENAGQFDLLMYPAVRNDSRSFTLNYTYINNTLSGGSRILGAAPRWILPVKVQRTSEIQLSLFDSEAFNTSATIIVWNTTLEKVHIICDNLNCFITYWY
jgi:hypothetical protein